MAVQVAASGIQVCAAACCGVSSGGLLVSATERGSISPMRRRSPFDSTRTWFEPSPKATSIRHRFAPAAGSRQRNVGAMISGGKIDPSSG